MDHTVIIYGVLNFIAAILSGASGSGGSLISGAPLLTLLGIPPAQAIATARFGGFGLSLGASGRFFREKITDKRAVIIFSIIGLISGLIGSSALVHFSNKTEILQKLIGLVILVIGIPTMYIRSMGLEFRQRPA